MYFPLTVVHLVVEINVPKFSCFCTTNLVTGTAMKTYVHCSQNAGRNITSLCIECIIL